MNENLHIDDAVKQEVSKGNFPYQEAHWDALAARLPAESARESVLWPWLVGLAAVIGIMLVLWQPWQVNIPQYNIEAIAPVNSSLPMSTSKEEANINFISLRDYEAIPTWVQQPVAEVIAVEEPSENLTIVDTVEETRAFIKVDSVVVSFLDISVDAYAPKRRPRSPYQVELTPWKKWGVSVWAGPSFVYRNLVVTSSDPTISLVVAVWDSVESPRQSNAYGIQIQRLIKKRWNLALGLNMTDMGLQLVNDSLTFSQPEPGDPYAFYQSYHFNYLETELGMNYILKRTRPTVYTKASIAPSVLLKARREATTYYREWEPRTSVDDYPREDFHSFNLYGSVGAGIVWPGQGRINLMVEPTFTYGLLPIENGEHWNTFLYGMQIRSGLVVKW